MKCGSPIVKCSWQRKPARLSVSDDYFLLSTDERIGHSFSYFFVTLIPFLFSFLPSFFDHISAVECHFDRFAFIFFFHQTFPLGLCRVCSPLKLYPYPSVSWSPSPFFSPRTTLPLPPSLLPPSSLRSSFAPTFSHTCSLSLDLLF